MNKSTPPLYSQLAALAMKKKLNGFVIPVDTPTMCVSTISASLVLSAEVLTMSTAARTQLHILRVRATDRKAATTTSKHNTYSMYVIRYL